MLRARPPRLPPPPAPPRTRRGRAPVAALPPDAFAPVAPPASLWVAALVPAGVFVFGAVEFTKRLLIQRRCAVCEGKGLVTAPASGRLVKCRQCGGFFPWQSWSRFLEATAAPGNGGPLRAPRGQTSVVYRVPPPRPRGEGEGKEET